jgi:trigger factor
MRVSVKNVGTLGRRMTVAIPAEDIDHRLRQRLRELAKTVKLPGFRPGKIPGSVIESRFGAQVIHEIAGELIQSSWPTALAQESLVPAAAPSIEPKQIKRGEDLEYVASFEILPEIVQPDIEAVEIKRPVCNIQDEDIDRTLERMRAQRVSFSATDGAAEIGDQVKMDFVGKIDGEAFEGGTAEDFPLVLGSGAVLKELEEGLLGVKVGDTKSVTTRFPDDYPSPEVAGKDAVFDVTVKEVGKPQIPELDDEFAAAFGVETGGIAQLRKEVRANLERERDDRTRQRLRDAVMEALLTRNQPELPQQLVDEEIDRVVQQAEEHAAQRQAANEPVDRSLFIQPAEKRVALGLIIREVIKKHELVPDAQKVRERITAMAAGYQQPEQFIQWYYSDADRLNQIQSVVLEEQVVEKLLEQANIVDEEMNLSALLNLHDHDHDHDHDQKD